MFQLSKFVAILAIVVAAIFGLGMQYYIETVDEKSITKNENNEFQCGVIKVHKLFSFLLIKNE